MMKFGIACKEGNRPALAVATTVIDWVHEHGASCILEDHIAAHLGRETGGDVWRDTDVLVVLGGDGTLLRSIRMVNSRGRQTPILGVHMGYLGFLTEVTHDEIFNALDDVLHGRYVLDERPMVDVRLMRGGEVLAAHPVLNDAVITKGALARIIDIEVFSGKEFITRYRADGIIVSTPTGSTAYNLAAGGPIVHPTVRAMILSPLCPHVLSNRSLVLPDDQELSVSVSSTKASDNVYLTLDGQLGYPMEAGDSLVCKRGDSAASLVRFPQRSYYEVLRSKLRWLER